MSELANELKSYIDSDIDVMAGVYCPGPPYRPIVM